MNGRIKVLHIIGALNMGGAETMVMNIFRNIDRSRFQFDFYLSGNSGGYYENEAKQLGARIINVGRRKKNPLKYCLTLFKLIRREKYDVIQIHATDAQDGLPALIAKLAGAKKICLYSHCSSGQSEGRQRIMRKLFMGCVTDPQACSDKAAEWMFGNNASKAVLLPLPIDCKECKYESKFAEEKKEQLGLPDDTIVIGHVGRFFPQKNHIRLIEIFDEVAKKDARYHLILIGDGYLREKIEATIKKYALDDRVTLLGTIDRAYKYLSLFDVFVLPSFYEGFPTVLLEAQANALPIVAASTVTKTINITGLVNFVSLEDSNSIWADTILGVRRTMGQEEILNSIIAREYDCSIVARRFEEIYGAEN